ncbi:MAG: DUF4446 family protein [Akkermansiaceae bacterium]|nr:DUF4446 family protein [Armatimonadota bacterium]
MFFAQLPPVLNALATPLLDFLRRDPATALLVTMSAFVCLFFGTVFLLVRTMQMSGRQARLLRGTDGKDVQRMLIEHVGTMEQLATRVERAAHYGESNAASLQNCLQKVGVVRFDAFADLGGRQSFSIAILDADENGVVLTGLSARHETRMYAKPVEHGLSIASVPLTPEEEAAVDAARAGGPGTDVVGAANSGEPLPGTMRDKLTQVAVSAGVMPPRPVPLHSNDRFSAALRNGN